MKEVIISGYSTAGADPMGIYQWDETAAEGTLLWSDGVESPSFLCFHEDECFAATERDGTGSFHCFVREGKKYRLSDSITLEGDALCHIAYSPRHSTLYGAFYGTGHVAAMRVEGHKFAEVLNHFAIEKDGYPLSRAHCCVPDPAEEYAYVCNIAQDRIYSYRIESGRLIPNADMPYLQLGAGIGPRHICFLPNGRTAYMITEYSNEIYILDCDPERGVLKEKAVLSVPPEDFAGETFCSGMAFSGDFRFLYGANRGANTISVFAIQQDGGLVKIQNHDCGGNWPRHISVSKDGKTLLSANQRSGEVSFLKLSPETGKLEGLLGQIPFGEPSFAACPTCGGASPTTLE